MGKRRGRRQQRDVKLAPIGLAIGGMLLLGLIIALGVTIEGLHYLHFKEFKPEPELSAGTLYNLLKVAFAVAVGIGGIVALVTAYRKQRVSEFAERREGVRLFNDRFAAAAGQLGDDKSAVQLAGAYAMARLADDWPQQRQICADVLCAYLRIPYESEPAADAPSAEHKAFRGEREVRHTIIRLIAAHLQSEKERPVTMQDWRGLAFDFTGVVFDGGDFDGAHFAGGAVASFDGAQFTGGETSFIGAHFVGRASFVGAKFTGGMVRFDHCQVTGIVQFDRARFASGKTTFDRAHFRAGWVSFTETQFTGGEVSFIEAEVVGCRLSFAGSTFDGTDVSFYSIRIPVASRNDLSFRTGAVTFNGAVGSAPPSGIDWVALGASVRQQG